MEQAYNMDISAPDATEKGNRNVGRQIASTAVVGLLSSAAHQRKTIDWMSICDRLTNEMTKPVSV